MNRIVQIFIAGLFIIPLSINAQQPKTPPPAGAKPAIIAGPGKPAATPGQAKPGGPVKPGGYVLKKDYDVQMEEMTSRVRSAAGTAAGVRKDLNEKLSRLDTISGKMQQVEAILNSANFKIENTSDSLKTTRVTMDELKKEADANFRELKEQDHLMLLIGAGLAGLTILLFVLIFIFSRLSIGKLKKELSALTTKLTVEMQKNNSLMKEEMSNLRTGLQGDIFSVKNETTVKFLNAKDDTDSRFNSIMAKLDEKQDKIVEESEDADVENPEDKV